MRIAFDVSPLSHPPLGIGNYIRGSLSGLVEAAGGRHEIVAFAPTSLRGPCPHPRGARRHRRRASNLAAAGVARAPHALEQGWPSVRRAPPRPLRRAALHGLDVPATVSRRARDDDPRPRPAPSPRVVHAEDDLDALAEVREHRAHLRPRVRELRVHGAGRGTDARGSGRPHPRRPSRSPAAVRRGRRGGRPRARRTS